MAAMTARTPAMAALAPTATTAHGAQAAAAPAIASPTAPAIASPTAPAPARRVPLPRAWPVRAGDVVALVVANAVLVVLMWVRHGGLDQLTTVAGVFTAAGQLTALLGTYLVLLELLLMSRSPWLDQAFGRHLEDAGATRFAINAGGDVVTRGEPEPGRPWRVEIRHPDRADPIVAVVGLRSGAVATSGAYERGEHVVDPHTGRPPEGLASLTVVGPSLTWADAYATAGFAMGPAGIAWVTDHPGFGAYGVTSDRQATWTPLVDDLLVRE